MIEEWEGCHHQWAMMHTRRADARVTDTCGVCKIVNWELRPTRSQLLPTSCVTLGKLLTLSVPVLGLIDVW